MNSLTFNGAVIRDRSDFLCLTDMWKGAREPDGKRPVEWLRTGPTQEFVSYLAATVKGDHRHLIDVTRGRTGSTWAHWQIAMAYAKHLSPEFHAWCNTVVRERMEGKAPAMPGGMDPAVIGGIVKSVVGKQVPEIVQAVAQQILAEQLPAMIAAAIAADPRRAVLPNMTALEIAQAEGVPARKRRGLVNSISARLRRYCQSWEVWPVPDGRGVWTFPRQVVGPWLDHEGRALIASHMARVAGQGVLAFPQKRRA